jgi:hypothetical protein
MRRKAKVKPQGVDLELGGAGTKGEPHPAMNQGSIIIAKTFQSSARRLLTMGFNLA